MIATIFILRKKFWKKNFHWMQPIIFHLHIYVKVYIVNKINIHTEIDRCSRCFFYFLKDPRNNGRTCLGELEPCSYGEFISLHEFIWNVYWLREKFIDLNFATSDKEIFLDAMSLDIIEELNSPLWEASVDFFTLRM